MTVKQWGRIALAMDVALVLTFALFLHALLIGGLKLAWLSEPDSDSSGLVLILSQDYHGQLKEVFTDKEMSKRLFRLTDFARTLAIFLVLLPARMLLTRRFAPDGYRARYRTRVGKFKLRAAVGFWVFLVALAAAELAARRIAPTTQSDTSAVLDDPIQKGGPPTLKAGSHAQGISVNSLGFRGPEVAIPSAAGPPPEGPASDGTNGPKIAPPDDPPPATNGDEPPGAPPAPLAPKNLRILFMGDSFTFGAGVEESQTFVRRVETSLRASGRSVDLINGGMWTYDTKDEVALLEHKLPQVRPDAVVIVFFPNDALPNIVLGRVGQKLYRDVALFKLAWDFYEVYRDKRKFEPDYVNDAYRAGEPEWDECVVAFGKFRDLAREHGFVPLVVIHPLLERLQDFPFDPTHETVHRLLDDLGLPYLDLAASFRGRDESDLWNSKQDHHANPLGHEIAADGIRPWLEARLDELARVRDSRRD